VGTAQAEEEELAALPRFHARPVRHECFPHRHARVLTTIIGAEYLIRVPCFRGKDCLCSATLQTGIFCRHRAHQTLATIEVLIVPACCIAQEVRAAGVGAACCGGQGADRGGAVRPRDGAPPVRMTPRKVACCAARFAASSVSAALARADRMTIRVCSSPWRFCSSDNTPYCGMYPLQASPGGKHGAVPAGACAARGQVCGAASAAGAGWRGVLAPHHKGAHRLENA